MDPKIQVSNQSFRATSGTQFALSSVSRDLQPHVPKIPFVSFYQTVGIRPANGQEYVGFIPVSNSAPCYGQLIPPVQGYGGVVITHFIQMPDADGATYAPADITYRLYKTPAVVDVSGGVFPNAVMSGTPTVVLSGQSVDQDNPTPQLLPLLSPVTVASGEMFVLTGQVPMTAGGAADHNVVAAGYWLPA